MPPLSSAPPGPPTPVTVTMPAAGLDPGIGMFHADIDGRSSLALDAIEATRPHVDHWLLAYLASSAFANRAFTELSDGEVRLSHPLNSHLAYTAALWREVCRAVADWLVDCFGGAAGGVMLRDELKIMVQRTIPPTIPPKLLGQERRFNPLTPLPAFSGPARCRREKGFGTIRFP